MVPIGRFDPTGAGWSANPSSLRERDIDLLRRCFAAGRARDADYRGDDGGALPRPEMVDKAASFLRDLKPGEPAGLPAHVWDALWLCCFVGAELLGEEDSTDALLTRCDTAISLIQAVPFAGI